MRKKTKKTLQEMTRYIGKNQITDLVDFALYCIKIDGDWFNALTTHVQYINDCIESIKRKKRRQQMA